MTLELAGGNQSKAAQMLGISRGTFRTKLAKAAYWPEEKHDPSHPSQARTCQRFEDKPD